MPHEAVRTLEPATRDMFLQAVRDDDSYVFSNAVLGLAALANLFGADVLRALVHVYADSLQARLRDRTLTYAYESGKPLGEVIRRRRRYPHILSAVFSPCFT